MTSPGGWFGDFLDEQVGKRGSRGGSQPSLPRAPSDYSGPADRGSRSAGSLERQAESRGDRYGEPTQATPYGQVIFDALDLPEQFGRGTAPFTMGIGMSGEQFSDYYGNPVNGIQVTQMSVAAGVEWLRNEAVNNPEGYNSLVVLLWQAGYLSQADVRLNTFTSKIGQAFAEAAYDVSLINAKQDGGAVVTMGDHLDAIVRGYQEIGFGPAGVGDGADGAAPPTRVNRLVDEADLKAQARATAQALLGRSLNDDEEARIIGMYRSIESQWNAQMHSASMAQYNGLSADVPDRPDPSASILGFVSEEFEQEKAGQDLGSYVGVMGRMMGLGSIAGMNGLATG